MSQLLNKMKRKKKEKKILLHLSGTVLLCFQEKTQHKVFACAHNHDRALSVFTLIFEVQKSGTNLNGVPIWGVEGGEGG